MAIISAMKRFELFFAFILLPLDIVMIISSFVLAFIIRNNFELAPIAIDSYLRYAAFLLPVWLIMLVINGLYYVKNNHSFLNVFLRIVNVSSTTILFLIVAIFLSHTSDFSRLILVLTWVISILLISLGRLIVNVIQLSLLKYGVGARNLLLVGDNSVTQAIINRLNRKDSGYIIKGVLNDDGAASAYGSRIIGSIEDLTILREKKIDEVVLTDPSISRKKVMFLIQACSDNNIVFKYVPDVFSIMSLSFTQSFIGPMPVLELRSIPLEGWGRIIKRLLDVVFSAVLLVVLSPLFLLLALAIKLTSNGPIIYANKRVGRDEKPFNFYKFRSMFFDRCDYTDGTKWTTREDEKTRITPIGLLLRKTNLDELPQLWNILLGDMSFVGPRPEFPKIVEKFEKEIPDYFRRHRVKAGLTGWAQVNGFKGDTSVKERVRFDVYYIENWSLWLDIKIVIRTFWLVLYETFAGKYEYRTHPRVDN